MELIEILREALVPLTYIVETHLWFSTMSSSEISHLIRLHRYVVLVTNDFYLQDASENADKRVYII